MAPPHGTIRLLTRELPAIVVLISGRGSNLQALIDAVATGRLPVAIRAVISNRPEAPGLLRAREAGIATRVVDHRQYPTRAAFEEALRQAIDAYEPKLVVLAGFMRLLGKSFVHHYAERMLNIHPSLLPAYRGLDTHARALADGAAQHGASVHFVTEDLDGGPVVLQAAVPVRANDTPDTLAARVLEQEHRLLPLAVKWFAQGRLSLAHHQAFLDGRPLTQPLQLHDVEER